MSRTYRGKKPETTQDKCFRCGKPNARGLFHQCSFKSEPVDNGDDEIASLKSRIEYEESMWASANDHPDDTYQFHNALEDNRRRIDKMHAELKALEALSNPTTSGDNKTPAAKVAPSNLRERIDKELTDMIYLIKGYDHDQNITELDASAREHFLDSLLNLFEETKK